MRFVVASWLLACTGCFTKPEYRGDDGGPPPSGDGSVIAPGDGTVSGCVPSLPAEAFDMGGGCGAWAVPTGTGTANLGQGRLHLTAAAGQSVSCASVTTVPFATGAFIEIHQVSGGMPGDTAFMEVAAAPSNVRLAYAIDIDTFQTQLTLTGPDTPNAITYSASAMTWWRLRPLGTDRIEASYSGDGKNWMVFGVQGGVTNASNRVLSLGASAAAGNVGFEIEALNICPP